MNATKNLQFSVIQVQAKETQISGGISSTNQDSNKKGRGVEGITNGNFMRTKPLNYLPPKPCSEQETTLIGETLPAATKLKNKHLNAKAKYRATRHSTLITDRIEQIETKMNLGDCLTHMFISLETVTPQGSTSRRSKCLDTRSCKGKALDTK